MFGIIFLVLKVGGARCATQRQLPQVLQDAWNGGASIPELLHDLVRLVFDRKDDFVFTHQVLVVPTPKSSSKVPISCPPNLKPLIPHLNARCLILSKPLTFAVNLAFWEAVWGPVRILHPLCQGKGAFLKLPRSTSASGYKHYKCYLTMGGAYGRPV